MGEGDHVCWEGLEKKRWMRGRQGPVLMKNIDYAVCRTWVYNPNWALVAL